MKKGFIMGLLLGILSAIGVIGICSSCIGISDFAANLINCLIGGAGLIGICFTLYFQARATELQAKATSDQIDANRKQSKSQFMQEMLSSFSVISDRKDKITIIPPVECKLSPLEQRTDVSTQFNVHCATLVIIISRYSARVEYPEWQAEFDTYTMLFNSMVDAFFPYAIAFKNAAEKITENEMLDEQEKKGLLQSLHETLSTNDARVLGVIYRLPHFKNSEWINEHFTRERCVQSIRNSIKNVFANRQLKDKLQLLIGDFNSQVRLEKAAAAFVCGLENATMEENTYWSLYVATCCSKE